MPPDTRHARVAYVGLGALFNGFIIRISDLPVYLSWLPYIMVTYWGFAGILVNDFTGDLFGCEASVLECATRTGDTILLQFSFETVDPYVSMLVMVAMALLFRGLAVLDFFLRYIRGRGKGMRLVSGGQDLHSAGVGFKALRVGFCVPSKRFLTPKMLQVGTVMRSMMQGRGNAGKRMMEEAKKTNADNTQRVNENTGTVVNVHEEWDNEEALGDANNVKIAKKQPFWVELFLNRTLWVGVVFVDFGVLGVTCALSTGGFTIVYIFVGVNTIVALLFLAQFVVSICYMVPMTPKGPKDCTWAGTASFSLKTLGTNSFRPQESTTWWASL
jgi:hypothetical protein